MCPCRRGPSCGNEIEAIGAVGCTLIGKMSQEANCVRKATQSASKLTQEADIVFGKAADVGDLITPHAEPFDSQSEGEP